MHAMIFKNIPIGIFHDICDDNSEDTDIKLNKTIHDLEQLMNHLSKCLTS